MRNDMATISQIKLQQAIDRARIMREAMEHTTTVEKLKTTPTTANQTEPQNLTEAQHPYGTLR